MESDEIGRSLMESDEVIVLEAQWLRGRSNGKTHGDVTGRPVPGHVSWIDWML